jgi:hypothetical protein
MIGKGETSGYAYRQLVLRHCAQGDGKFVLSDDESGRYTYVHTKLEHYCLNLSQSAFHPGATMQLRF